MRKLTSDQWMGVLLAVMVTGVAGLFVLEMTTTGSWSSVAPVAHGDPMPPVEGVDLEGRPLQLAQGQTGGEVLLLDFWATWCPPCREEMPVLEDLHRRYGAQGLRLIAVNTEHDGSHQAQAELVRGFLADQGLDVPVLLDDGRLQQRYRVQSLPTLYLIGRDGTVRQVYVGAASGRRIERDVRAALAEG